VIVFKGVKGLVIAKILRENADCVRIVSTMFDRVKSTGLPCSRYLCRVIPLSHVFFGNMEELETNVAYVVGCLSQPSPDASVLVDIPSEPNQEETLDEPCAKRVKTDHDLTPTTISSSPRLYSFQFKKRNHNTLSKHESQGAVLRAMPPGYRLDYHTGQVTSEKR
jgi:hypothetical protein